MAEQVRNQRWRGRMLQAPAPQGSRGPWPVRKKQLQRAIPGPNTSVNTASCSAGVSGSGVLRSAFGILSLGETAVPRFATPFQAAGECPGAPVNLQEAAEAQGMQSS